MRFFGRLAAISRLSILVRVFFELARRSSSYDLHIQLMGDDFCVNGRIDRVKIEPSTRSLSWRFLLGQIVVQKLGSSCLMRLRILLASESQSPTILQAEG